MTNIAQEILQTYLVAGTQDTGRKNFLPVLEQALQAGITCFQFRDKGPNSLPTDAMRYEYAQKAQALCHTYHVPFIIDDRLELALDLQADGLHVGQSDQPWPKIEVAKQHGLITGLSCHTAQEILNSHQQATLDYIGVGPIFPTNSKEDAKTPVGLAQLKAFVELSQLPVVAIGGISLKNCQQIAETGVAGAAVISAITQAKNIPQAVQTLNQFWQISEGNNHES